MLQYILSFIILISVVVFIHEYGHYYFAKKYKVGVTDFSIGFGKELIGFNDKDGTRWKICAIPLGGYVKFFGDSNSASQPVSLSKIDSKDHDKLLTTKPLYQRAIIVSAGPIANFKTLAHLVHQCLLRSNSFWKFHYKNLKIRYFLQRSLFQY